MKAGLLSSVVGACLVALWTPASSAQGEAVRKPSAEQWFSSGLRALQAGNLTGAKSFFEKVLAEVPNHPHSRHYLARINLVEKRLDQAAEEANQTGPRLDRVKLHRVSLDEGLFHLKAQAEKAGLPRWNYVLGPELQHESDHSISLDLAGIPLQDAARYLALAGGAEVETGPSATFFRRSSGGRWQPKEDNFALQRTLSQRELDAFRVANATLEECLTALRSRAGHPRQPLNCLVLHSPASKEAQSRFDLDLERVSVDDVLKLIAELNKLELLYQSSAVLLVSPERLAETPEEAKAGESGGPPRP